MTAALDSFEQCLFGGGFILPGQVDIDDRGQQTVQFTFGDPHGNQNSFSARGFLHLEHKVRSLSKVPGLDDGAVGGRRRSIPPIPYRRCYS